MSDKFFATTPIYYVNAAPHIGHTYTTVAADVITRYWKQQGKDSWLLTGTDEHGAKIAEAAEKNNQEPQAFADQISEEFKKAWELLNIDYVRFIRTTDEDHIKTAQEFLQKMYDSGFIDPKPRLYTGLYCVSCEKFWQKEDLKDGLCPDHLKPPVEHSEENYYFRLSDPNISEKLKEAITSDKLKILPASRKNEMLGKLEQGLEDISISRANLSWGIPLPFDPSHTCYVWVEALINYYTYGSQNNFWPADLHLVGKDILWFHTVIWGAMLLSIKEELPKEVFAHGFFSIDGQKMSKTIGNVITPQQLVDRYGVDGARYVLLSAFPFGEDGDFSWKKLDEKFNADLANGLGNLAARVAKLCERCEFELIEDPRSIDAEDFAREIQNLNFSGAITIANNYLRKLDEKLSSDKPWEIKDNEELKQVLKYYVDEIIKTTKLFQPFIPQTAEKILAQFSGKIKSGKPLFPRIS